MCIAIAQPEATRLLPLSMFRKCADRNDDGLGMSWIDWRQPNPLRRLRILRIAPDSKRKFDVDRFWERYRQVHQHWGKNSPIMVHFRMSTRGVIDQYNCHPFIVNPMTAMMHNGILAMPATGKGIKNLFHDRDVEPEYSDTWHYAHKYFFKFNQWRLHDKKFIKFHEDFIGTNNKLVFMDCTEYTENDKRNGYKSLIIYNEAQGVWDDGVWFSNTGYKEYASACQTNNTTYRRPHRYWINGKWSDEDDYKLCANAACGWKVYTSGETYCYNCREDMRIAKIDAEWEAKYSEPVKAEPVTPPTELNEEQYAIEKGGENPAHTDTKFYPAVGVDVGADGKTIAVDASKGLVQCSWPACTTLVPHKNQHYCQRHLDERIEQNKKRREEEAKADASVSNR